MKRIRLDEVARGHLREIYRSTSDRWNDVQASKYIRHLSGRFDDIAAGRAHSRSIPLLLGVEGYFCRCEAHFIYWRPLNEDAIAIVAILHQRMHQPERVKAAFERSR